MLENALFFINILKLAVSARCYVQVRRQKNFQVAEDGKKTTK